MPDCEQPLTITNSSIQVIFKDAATNKYLYDQSLPLYSKDSISIYDPQGTLLFLFKGLSNDVEVPTIRFWAIDFGSLFDPKTDSVSFSREICKDFIVQYSYNERDTIKTCFRSKDEKCGSVFSTLKIYHEGHLLASATNTINATVKIIKN